MVDTPTENINIQLGDIIEIIAPENPDLNLQQFYIEYINPEKIIIINIENQKQTTLNIIDGELEDTTISQIDLLSRAETSSYAKQHNLLPGVWIEILFKTSDMLNIKGLITNLEEDMIEVKTYPDDDILYIDFAYQGIPEDFSIDKITIIKNPSTTTIDEPLAQPSIEKSESSLSQSKIDSILQETGFTPDDAAPEIIQTQMQQAILDANQIQLGEDLDEITIFVDVPEDEKRYSLEQQTNDLLDELLGNVSTDKRTDKLLNYIHTTIERFVQLRSIYSDLDTNGYPIMPQPISNNYKPIIKTLADFKKHFPWLIPISTNKNKLYNIDKTIAEELSTILNLNLGTTLYDETQIAERFVTGQLHSDDNHYNEYINSINELYTPFETISDPNNSIISKQVASNILSIVNNLDDIDTIVASSEEGEITRKKFFFETYTRGLEYLKNVLTNSDNITITSIMTLTIPFLLFTKINLPSTSIFDRSQLNLNYLYYSNIINKNTLIPQIITIDNLIDTGIDDTDIDTEFNIMQSDIFRNLQQYILDETLYHNSSDDTTYKKFLSQIIPNNFKCLNIIKSFSTDLLSNFSIIKQLELFDIYHKDINISLYEKITAFIESNITNYKNRLYENIKYYKSFSSKQFVGPKPSEWFSIMAQHTSINNILLEAYDIKPTFTTSELFSRIYNLDYGNLFNIALVRINLDLQTDKLLEEFVEKYQQSMDEKSLQDNNCKNITKKYTSLELLQADNDTEITVDPEFDETDYKFLDKFKTDQESMEPSAFKEFLKNKLIELKNLTANMAERQANDIIAKQSIIQNGDYALLTLADGATTYFVRNDNKWVEDKTIVADNVRIENNKLFCNLQSNCISDNNKCNTFENTESNLSEEVLQQIYKEFDSTYEKRADKIKSEIDILLEKSIMRIKLIKRYKTTMFYKYDTLKRDIADQLDEEPELALPSPYEKLRDIILGQEDFVKRQNFIQKFVIIFTRPPFSHEDSYWLYCIKTGVKLLPKFLSTLANIFISGGDYLYELDVIVTNQGTISDDGDTFVDKYSGYFIKKIEFDTEEGFTEEGFKLKTREKMEKDLGDHVLELASEPQPTGNFLTGEARLIANIINAITGPGGMGINISNQKQFIIDNVLQLHKDLVPTEQQYEKMTKKSIKEKKTIQPYEDLVGRPLIILTFIYILIAIQTNIPSIETTKTFPNCIKAFDGYPILGDDTNAITYLACIARKMKNKEYPWSSIYAFKEDKIITQMKALLDNKKYKILSSPSIRLKIDEKRRYIKTKRKDIKLDIDASEKIIGFFPPTVPFTIKVYPLAEGFPTLLARNIKSGSHMQQDQINVIKSKIIKFGLFIQESIKNIINKQEPLVTSKAGIIFLENACCNSTSTDIHKYFTDLDSSLIQNNNIVTSLSDIIYDIYSASSGPLLYDPRDSRYYYPELPSGFSNNTIYKAFIVFCKNKTLNLNPDLLDACGITESYTNPDETIDEKIEIMKNDGINYSDDLFQQLLTLVNLKNIVTTDIIYSYPNKVQQFSDLLNYLNDNSDTVIPDLLVKDLLDLLDRYSLKDESASGTSRKIKNFLDTENTKLLDKINLFIKSNSSLSKSKMTSFSSCIDNITQFLEIGDNITITNEDSTTFKAIQFITNIIKSIIKVFPNIVLNKINYQDTKIPKHWNLSSRHQLDIKEIINNYYKNLKSLYGIPDLIPILQNIQEKCSNILKLSEYTPFFSSISMQETVVSSVFDSRLILLLYKFYFLKTLEVYIDLSKITETVSIPKPVISVADETPKEDADEVERTIEAGPSEEEQVRPEVTTQTFIAQATIAGSKLETMQIVTKYIISIVDIICSHKRDIDYNKESIMNKILSSKEKEKKEITDYLKNLTDEEREVENIFKNQKLEKWSKGLQKGLTQYVQETYDEEREQAEQELIKEKQIAKQTGISDMNKNIYAYEFDADAELAEEIDREVYSLEDYPGEDGDEPDYDEFELQDEF